MCSVLGDGSSHIMLSFVYYFSLFMHRHTSAPRIALRILSSSLTVRPNPCRIALCAPSVVYRTVPPGSLSALHRVQQQVQELVRAPRERPARYRLVSQNPSRWSNHGVSRRSTALAASSAPRLAALAGAASAFRPCILQARHHGVRDYFSDQDSTRSRFSGFPDPPSHPVLPPPGSRSLAQRPCSNRLSHRGSKRPVLLRAPSVRFARVCCSTFSASRHGVIWIRTISRIQFQPVGPRAGILGTLSYWQGAPRSPVLPQLEYVCPDIVSVADDDPEALFFRQCPAFRRASQAPRPQSPIPSELQ